MQPPAPPSARAAGRAHPVARRGVTVRLGSASSPATRRESPVAVMVGLAGPDAPWLQDLYPGALVKSTRYRDPHNAVEHVRLSSRDNAEGLPGLDGSHRSRLRDAARLALSVGAPSVDVVLARVGGLAPWEVGRSEVAEAMDPFLSELTGAVLVMPDLGGPIPVGPGTAAPMERRVRDLVDCARRHRERWAERYQVALLDDPGAEGDDQLYLIQSLIGCDAALCRWRGSEGALRRHGWRAGSASLAGLLAVDGEDVGRALVGRTVPLAPGRGQPKGRIGDLSLDTHPLTEDDRDSAYLELQLSDGVDSALVTHEPTFRPPISAWPLPALRVVKNIHRLIVESAERFVFQTVDDTQAIALAVALQRAVRAYSSREMLVGPDGAGLPDIRGGVHRSPESPGLFAIVTATLRPWSQSISVRVSLRPGAAPSLEVQ